MVKYEMADFQKITTGNGFQNDLIATTNNRLEMTVTALESLESTTRANMMFLQGDVQDLTEMTKKAKIE